MSRVLITGATGFVGRHAIAALAARHEVWALVRRIPEQPDPRVRWLLHDLSLARPIAGLPRRIDAVVHLAQSPNYRAFPERGAEIHAVSAGATATLLDWAVRAGASRFVLASTGGVYGTADAPLAEDQTIPRPSGPLGFYFATKLMAETLLQQYEDRLSPAVLRYFFLYGQGQSPQMLLPRLLASIRDGRPIRLQGEEGLRYNPLHISDAVAATVAAVERECSGIFNVAGPEITTLRQVCETLGELCGVAPRFERDLSAPTNALVADIARAREALAAPRVGLAEGLRDVVGGTP